MSAKRPYAVIDIGSNSVRLVVYRHFSRAPVQSFNEKSMCALGRGVARTGALDDQAVETTLEALDRYASLARSMGASRIDVFATAAVRDATNRASFLAQAAAMVGQPVALLSGEDEARTAALGVLSGFNQPTGLVADLGGGSLEVAGVGSGVIDDVASMPLGVISLMERAGGSAKKARRILQDALRRLGFIGDVGSDRPLFAVGGSWRALARGHMEHVNWPLRVAHQYEIEADECRRFTKQIIDQADDPGFHLPGAPRKRQADLAAAAIVLETLLERSGARSVIFSATGVREGRLFDAIDHAMRTKDPLVHAASGWGRVANREPGLGQALTGFTAKLHATSNPRLHRLRQAACHVSDIAWRDNPDNRGNLAFSRLVQFPFVAIDHYERIALALAVHFRYGGVSRSPDIKPLTAKLPKDLLAWAEIQGRAMQLAYRFSGGVSQAIKRSKLTIDNQCLNLVLPLDHAVAKGDAVERRIQSLRTVTGLKSSTIIQY